MTRKELMPVLRKAKEVYGTLLLSDEKLVVKLKKGAVLKSLKDLDKDFVVPAEVNEKDNSVRLGQ